MTYRDGGWWFQYDGQEYGPYSTRKEAESDLRGLERFEKYKDKPGFITTEKGVI